MSKQKLWRDAVHRATFRSTRMCQCERCARPGLDDLAGAILYAAAIIGLVAAWSLS